MFVFGIVGQLVWVFSDEVVMGSIPFGDSEIFFVSCLHHVDEFSVILSEYVSYLYLTTHLHNAHFPCPPRWLS